jgi:hypothetical protein
MNNSLTNIQKLLTSIRYITIERCQILEIFDQIFDFEFLFLAKIQMVRALEKDILTFFMISGKPGSVLFYFNTLKLQVYLWNTPVNQIGIPIFPESAIT